MNVPQTLQSHIPSWRSAISDSRIFNHAATDTRLPVQVLSLAQKSPSSHYTVDALYLWKNPESGSCASQLMQNSFVVPLLGLYVGTPVSQHCREGILFHEHSHSMLLQIRQLSGLSLPRFLRVRTCRRPGRSCSRTVSSHGSRTSRDLFPLFSERGNSS